MGEEGGVRFVDDDFCFACGGKNPLGLHLEFALQPDGACKTEFEGSPHHQGFKGVLHGGIIATIADDLMNNHLFRMFGVSTATAEISARFKRSAPTGDPIVFASRKTGGRGGIHEMECEVRLKECGTLLSVCKGRFVEVEP